MTVEELAVYPLVGSGTVRNWVSQKYIPHAKKGRIVRFHRQAIEAWSAVNSCPGKSTIAQDILPQNGPVPKAKGVIIDVLGIADSTDNVNTKLIKKVAPVVDGELQYRFIKDQQALVAHYTQLANKTATGM